MTSVSSELADFATGLRLDGVPLRTRERAKDLLFDAVGCAVAGHRGEETPQIERFVERLGGGGNSTVIGRELPSDLLGASLLNAYLTTAVTVCDVYVPAHCHITPEIVPPAMAVAEREGATGDDLLLAIVTGLEVTSRVARGLDYPSFRARGWHAPGVIGPFGAGAAVGKLLGADLTQMRNILGLAGSQSAGTWAAWGTPTVKFHQSRGAAAGLLAGLLGMEGLGSSPDILAHPDGGILPTYSGGGHASAITEGLGEIWELERISLRLWPGGTPLQTIITGIRELLDSGWDVAIDDIELVTVTVAPGVYDAHARFVEPTGTFESLLSIHFVVAVFLQEHGLWLDHTGPDHYADPKLRAFQRHRVRLKSDPSLTPTTCRIEIKSDQGVAEVTVEAPKGHPDNPPARQQLIDKFLRCTSGRLEAPEDLAAALLKLEDARHVSEVTLPMRKVVV